jgi:hypothetical protein
VLRLDHDIFSPTTAERAETPSSRIHQEGEARNQRGEVPAGNPVFLRQQMGDSSVVMTARCTAEIPVEQAHDGFSNKSGSKIDGLKNIEK